MAAATASRSARSPRSRPWTCCAAAWPAEEGRSRRGPLRARCFVAVEAPPGLVGQLGGLERPARAGLRWTEPHQWHVTLCFVGSAEPDRVVAALPPDLPGPVEALAGPRPVPLSRHVWALPVAALDGLPPPVLTWRWVAGSVVAYRGELHPFGARYHEFGRWAVARR